MFTVLAVATIVLSAATAVVTIIVYLACRLVGLFRLIVVGNCRLSRECAASREVTTEL